MFWNKNKNNKKNKDKRKETQDLQLSTKEGKNSSSQGLAGDALRAQALANAREARENLGDETIQKIAEIMKKKEQSATEKAKRQIQNADSDRVVDGIRDIMDED